VDINLMKNSFDSEGMRLLCSGLLVNLTIRDLDVSYNKIDEEGTIWLSEVLKVNNYIRAINLEATSLNKKCLQNFITCFKNNTGLKYINFGLNKNIGTQGGFKILAEGLLYNNGIKSVNFMNCSIEETDIIFLLKLLQNKEAIDSDPLEILLGGNNFTLSTLNLQSEINNTKKSIVLK